MRQNGQTQRSRADNFTDANFVSIAGFEFTTAHGDLNTYNTEWFMEGSQIITPTAYYDYLVANRPGSIVQWNHPSSADGGIVNYTDYSASRDTVVELLEVVNRSKRYEASYVSALDAGWHIGPAAGQDNHNPDWLTGLEIRTAILATSLTRANIYEAIKVHRVYATENRNLRILYTINGNVMGSIISAGTCHVSIHVEDPDTNINSDRIRKIELVRNGGNVVATYTSDAHTVDWVPTITPCNAPYYFVRVTNAANKKAWTAPIWITAGGQYTLTISVVGSGVVTPSVGSHTYSYGDVVTLTAAPDAGWSFAGWSGDLSGSANPATITMEANKAVTATFTQIPYALTVSTIGSGSVSKDPDQAIYHYGDVVTLTAAPAVGWSFAGWSGDLSGSANPATITMEANKAITATFTQIPYALTVSTIGSGSVSKDPDQAIYHYGDVVTLTAAPDVGWSFAGWSGDLSGSANPAAITIDVNKTVTATFSLECTPIASVDLFFTPASPIIDQPVSFFAIITGGTTPITYTWNFGHGEDLVTTTATVLHSFPPANTLQTYMVTLTVGNGCSSLAVHKPVTVRPFTVYLPVVIHQ